MSDQELFEQLCEPFPTEIVEWRVGPTNARANGGIASKGQAIAYIDARAVMDRLDAVCGIGGWQRTYSQGVGNGSIICNIGIKVSSGEWVWKSDGAGATDMEAEKGAMSDAFKRAAVNFGIGRYLYEIDAPWIDLENGKHIPKSTRKQLDDLHDKAAQKIWWGNRRDEFSESKQPQNPQSGPISEAQADILNKMLAQTKTDAAKFLKYFKADSIDVFPAAKFSDAVEMLKKKVASNV